MQASIGIVGGVGPYAGLELQKAILRNVKANRDRDYPPVFSISAPGEIADRTEFLLGDTPENPAYAIIDQIRTLYSCGARFIGIPCNTAHSEKILSAIQSGIRDLDGLMLVDMLDELFRAIKSTTPDIRTVGVLATKGSYRSNVFTKYGADHDIGVTVPEPASLRDDIHAAIYDDRYGIKALGYLHEQSSGKIQKAIDFYRQKKIDTVILGCTELSVVLKPDSYDTVTLADPIDALAKKLLSLYTGRKEGLSNR